MKVTRIIHQQIRQLMWQLLVCFGLVMVLPIEEAILNYRDGDGFYSSNLVAPAVIISVLLAGLIACSNIQADFKQSRYIFWQSKPVRTILFIALKYFVGLIAALFIFACPVVFGFITSNLCGEDFLQGQEMEFVVMPSFLAIMTYSLCFASSILIRKTARGWLVGLSLASLGLLLSVMLMFSHNNDGTDMTDFVYKVFISVPCTISIGAFIFALIAAARNWHLKTNLKGLLWAAAVLIFSLMMFYGSQIANIKVLDELEIGQTNSYLAFYSGKEKLLGNYLEIENDKISISPALDDPAAMLSHSSHGLLIHSIKNKYDINEAYRSKVYYKKHLFTQIDGTKYCFDIVSYHSVKKGRAIYEKVFLVCSKASGNQKDVVSIIDFSDCLKSPERQNADFDQVKKGPRLAEGSIMFGEFHFTTHQYDNKIVAIINNSLAVIDISNPRSLRVIEKKLNVIKHLPAHYNEALNKEWPLPFLPVESISLNDRIKLSVDVHYQYALRHIGVGFSVYETADGNVAFCISEGDVISIGEVTRWDEKKVYCKLTASRSTSALERISGSHGNRHVLVQDQTLYAYTKGELMVFDIRVPGQIRKLGHFVRSQSRIRAIEVLANGDILMSRSWGSSRSPQTEGKYFLTLLKNPRR